MGKWELGKVSRPAATVNSESVKFLFLFPFSENNNVTSECRRLEVVPLRTLSAVSKSVIIVSDYQYGTPYPSTDTLGH
jgi:hypothetical protein